MLQHKPSTGSREDVDRVRGELADLRKPRPAQIATKHAPIMPHNWPRSDNPPPKASASMP
jgi:hypothetical protein